MTARYAIYFAPGVESAMWTDAQAWLTQPELDALAVSARRYGFHATIKAPMALTTGLDALEAALERFAGQHKPVALTGLAPRLIDGFLALTTEPQPEALTEFAAAVVEAFEPFRAPLSPEEHARRLKAPLTPRQIALVGQYGYPYVLEQFQFHMTLTDRLPDARRAPMQAAAADWFAETLRLPILLDRLVVFEEPEPGAPFRRLSDFVLTGA